MADHTTSAEDRIMNAATEVGNTVEGLLEIIDRLDSELDQAFTNLAEAKSRIDELERELESLESQP